MTVFGMLAFCIVFGLISILAGLCIVEQKVTKILQNVHNEQSKLNRIIENQEKHHIVPDDTSEWIEQNKEMVK